MASSAVASSACRTRSADNQTRDLSKRVIPVLANPVTKYRDRRVNTSGGAPDSLPLMSRNAACWSMDNVALSIRLKYTYRPEVSYIPDFGGLWRESTF